MHIHIVDPNSNCPICNGSETIPKVNNSESCETGINEIFLKRKTPTGWELIKNWLSKFLP